MPCKSIHRDNKVLKHDFLLFAIFGSCMVTWGPLRMSCFFSTMCTHLGPSNHSNINSKLTKVQEMCYCELGGRHEKS